MSPDRTALESTGPALARALLPRLSVRHDQTEPLLPYYYLAPSSSAEVDDAPTLVLVRRRPRTTPPQWNPPLSHLEDDPSLVDTVKLDRP